MSHHIVTKSTAHVAWENQPRDFRTMGITAVKRNFSQMPTLRLLVALIPKPESYDMLVIFLLVLDFYQTF